VKAAAAVCAACAFLAFGSPPALAVDRTLGSDVPKPTASGDPWTDAQIAALDANIDITLAGARTLQGAHVGVYAIDASDGRVLYQRNPDDRLAPASTLKLIVGSLALEKLGPAFRFHTEAVSTGPVVAGTLTGNIVVRAGGDPLLNAGDVDTLAAAIAAQGVRLIHGDVGFDVSRYEDVPYPSGWLEEDLAYGYAAQVGALAFEHNSLHLTVSPGAVAGDRAVVTSSPLPMRSTPIEGCRYSAQPRLFRLATTGAPNSPDSIDLVLEPFGCTRVVGSIPIGAVPETLDAAVPSPTAYAALALTEALARRGITVDALQALAGPPDRAIRTAPAGAPVVWSHDSEPLDDVVADCWIPSDNLAAEMLLREIAYATDGTTGTTQRGIALEQAWLKSIGVDPDAVILADGSGLSSYDRITPRTLVTVLQHDFAGPNRDRVLDDLPVAGVRGTLADGYGGSALEKRVFAKTGSLAHTNALAGYAATEKHGAVIFAFIVDDWDGDTSALRSLRTRVLTHLIED
jgi:D-alanyl-D-alanine carboxypeptidase/D-alanyl-D-alanine-endopeptidase (penicillin-binding protein 4)